MVLPQGLSEATVIQGLTGLEGDLPMAHSHSYWQEVSVPYHMGLSTGLLACSHGMAAGFPQTE